MNIENDIFKNAKVDFTKLEKYGFKKLGEIYIFEKCFLNNDFKATIIINNKGIVNGNVIDLQVNTEYLVLRTQATGEFANKVRQSYMEILKDIKKHCFESKNFIFDQSNRINKYIKNKYDVEPEFLWDKFPGYAIYRKNKKWFALIGNVQKNKVDKKSDETNEIEVINIKVSKTEIDNILFKKGIYEAYHMNKRNWVSIILDDTLTDEEIVYLLDNSYSLLK